MASVPGDNQDAAAAAMDTTNVDNTNEETAVNDAETESREMVSAAVLHDLETSYMALKQEKEKLEVERENWQKERELRNETESSGQLSIVQLKLQRANAQIERLQADHTSATERADRHFAEADRLRQEIT